MKKVILMAFSMTLMASVSSLKTVCQIVDNFESGNLGNWIASAESRWGIDSLAGISGKYSLYHIYDNPVSGIDCIGLRLKNLHPLEGLTRWSFSVRHGCDPSSTNNWAIFLMSDSDPAALAEMENISGYAVGVNLDGYDDTLRLWKLTRGDKEVVAACPVNWQASIGTSKHARLIVERSVSGQWILTAFDRDGSPSGTVAGNDSELFSPEWFGVVYRYTSTRDRLLWFDDLEVDGVFHEDKTPPSVTGCTISGQNTLDLTTSEELSESSLSAANFSVAGTGGTAISVRKMLPLSYRLEFGSSFRNKTSDDLIIKSLCDRSGNCAGNIIVPFLPVWPELGDVVISEIMADPVPAVSLPEREYLEITNRTGYAFNLRKWKLITGEQRTDFPGGICLPNEVIIICSLQDTLLFSKLGKVVGLKSFPALTDDGRIIILADSLDNMIHGVEYSSAWYGDELKSEGGWSLELIDTGYPFYAEGNWQASGSRKGGTPGTVNSVSRHNPDISFYGIENVFPEDSVTIILRLSETVINNGNDQNWLKVEGNGLISVKPADQMLDQYRITLQKPLKNKQIYTLFVTDDITDFAANTAEKASFSFGMPEQAGQGDIQFNELLFNPLPGDPDYIELYNCSEKIIDARRLFLAVINDDTRDTSHAEPATNEHRCIIPGTYNVITTDRDKIISRYYSSVEENIFNTGSLPSMPDDRGHLLLLNPELGRVDEVTYDEKMHYSLISGREGIALEKVRPESISADRMSWHTASESSGWGTPGAPNSVFVKEPAADDRVVLSSEKISPDNDGFEDLLMIDFKLEGNGNILRITVFDETGTYVRTVADNFLAGPEASVVWDGTADDTKLVNTGIYIILIELYNDKGKTRSWKKVCTVLR
ncbi:MAG: lamin tail domain-containing protein [Bacteroidales bacterium]|nr:lamin tail domain-containing protein [Bacteroidales bacterium]